MEHRDQDGPRTVQSRYSEGSIVCPACGRPEGVIMWDLLEADCNPERAEQLAQGDLFVHRCSHCEALLPLDYPLMYVDRTRKVAAYYPAGQGSLDAVMALFVGANQRFRGVDLSELAGAGCTLRVTPTRYGLAEKVTVWQAGLDDRIYEVFKQMLLEELTERNAASGLSDLQLVGVADDGAALVFTLFAEQPGEDGTVVNMPLGSDVTVPRAAYDRLVAAPELSELCARALVGR